MNSSAKEKQEALDKRYIRMASIWRKTHIVYAARWVHLSSRTK